jgi:site-specific recombinase XerD
MLASFTNMNCESQNPDNGNPLRFYPLEKRSNRPLGTTKVKLIIKEAAAAAGFTPEDVRAFSGHSLRVGAAQDLLCAGFDTAAIMRAGGWKSINVLGRYLEFAEHNVWG